MRELGTHLTERAPAILELWRVLITETPFDQPVGYDVGGLPEVIYNLIEASVLHPTDPTAHERHVGAAVRHGELRRQSGADEQVIWHEFEALREAIRHHLESWNAPLRREAQIRLDMAVSLAQMAAVRGFHRPMLEQTGVWEQLIPTMARRSPLLGLPALGSGS